MRESKDPKIRKKEIIDTAMQLFSEKGYEATSISDIARAIHVVPGLCYRYFSSKYELYQAAIASYVKECSEPIIKILEMDLFRIDDYVNLLVTSFIQFYGKEKYHEFFHKAENKMFHQQLNVEIAEYLIPYMDSFLRNMNSKGLIELQDTSSLAGFLLYGEIAIINDDSIATEEKTKLINKFFHKLIQ